MKTVKERVAYLPLLVGHYVKTPSTAGGMWFSFIKDDAITDPKRQEIESIGIFCGVDTFRERLPDTPDGEKAFKKVRKAVVDFTYRDLNNAHETFLPEEIIPILRPLHTISDEECLELALAEGYDPKIIEHRPHAIIDNIRTIFKWQNKDLMLSPTMTLWLALRAFDVTGAIEKGLSLDATKTELPVTKVQA